MMLLFDLDCSGSKSESFYPIKEIQEMTADLSEELYEEYYLKKYKDDPEKFRKYYQEYKIRKMEERGKYYESFLKFSRAKEVYSKAKEMSSNPEISFSNYRLSWIEENRLIELEKKREKGEISESTYLTKVGLAYLKDACVIQAIPLLKRAIDLDKSNVEAYFRLAKAYDSQATRMFQECGGMKEYIREAEAIRKKSFKIFKKILTDFPESEWADDAQFMLGYSRYSRAVPWRTVFEKIDPKKELKDAIKEYEKVVKNYPKSELIPTSLYGMARCYKELGDLKKMELIFQKIKEDYPMSREARWVKEGGMAEEVEIFEGKREKIVVEDPFYYHPLY